MQAWWAATIWERVKTSRRSHWTLPLTDDGEVATAAFALFRSLDWRGAAGVAAFEGRVERGAATAVAPVRPQEPKALEGHFPSRGEGEGGGEREGLHGEGGAEVTRKDCRWNNEVRGRGGDAIVDAAE